MFSVVLEEQDAFLNLSGHQGLIFLIHRKFKSSARHKLMQTVCQALNAVGVGGGRGVWGGGINQELFCLYYI